MSRKSDLISVITFVSILAMTGIAICTWMSVQSEVDRTGLIVGVIFLVLTALQSGLSVMWWCVTGKKQQTISKAKSQEIELKPAVT